MSDKRFYRWREWVLRNIKNEKLRLCFLKTLNWIWVIENHIIYKNND